MTKIMDSSKPWIACYWRWYQMYRKWGYSRGLARRNAGKVASNWWKFMKLHVESDYYVK